VHERHFGLLRSAMDEAADWLLQASRLHSTLNHVSPWQSRRIWPSLRKSTLPDCLGDGFAKQGQGHVSYECTMHSAPTCGQCKRSRSLIVAFFLMLACGNKSVAWQRGVFKFQ